MRKRSRTLSSAHPGRRSDGIVDMAANDENKHNHNNHHPHHADSQATEGICRHCGELIGRFFNLFHKVSGTYYLPALLGSWDSRLRPTAGRQPRTAAPDSELDGWYVRLIIFLSFVRVVEWHRSEGRVSLVFPTSLSLFPSRAFSIIHYPLAFYGLTSRRQSIGTWYFNFFLSATALMERPKQFPLYTFIIY